jgi:cytochrome c oxidase subunit 2
MVDSEMVLTGQTVVYTCYALAIISLIGWFGYKITKAGKSKVSSKFFYTFVGILVTLGITIHIITFNTIPWAAMDLNRAELKADQTFNINIANHEFQLPSETLVIHLNEQVVFSVTSSDLTYGFGVFRPDNSMVFQMQVVPGHMNDIMWKFAKPGIYTIRSTEYSGPKGAQMILPNAIEVVE